MGPQMSSFEKAAEVESSMEKAVCRFSGDMSGSVSK